MTAMQIADMLGFLQLRQDLTGPRQQIGTLLGERDAADRTPEQRHSEMPLEPGDHPRDRERRHAEMPRGPGETIPLGHGDEDSEGREPVHAIIPESGIQNCQLFGLSSLVEAATLTVCKALISISCSARRPVRFRLKPARGPITRGGRRPRPVIAMR